MRHAWFKRARDAGRAIGEVLRRSTHPDEEESDEVEREPASLPEDEPESRD